jgi:hypothetical protein
MRASYYVVIMFLLGAAVATAMPFPQPKVLYESVYEGEADVEIAGNEDNALSIQETSITIPVTRRRMGRWSTDLKLEVAWARFDVAGDEGFERNLYEIGVPVSAMRPINQNFMVRLGAGVNMASDLKKLDSSDLQYQGMGMLLHVINPSLRAGYGVIVSDFLSSSPVLPVIGLEWDISRRWTLDLIMPRIGMVYRHSDSTEFNLHAELRGDEWRVRGDEGEAFDFSSHRIHAGAGARLGLARNVTLQLDAGVTVLSELEFEADGVENTVEPEPTLFVKAALTIF